MPGLVILDRDGVLNEVVIDPEHGTIDSPLHPDQVRVFPWVPGALASLTRAGYTLAIATNQPSAAKGKTTRANLEDAHAKVVALAQSDGAVIAGSYICFHRSEDKCACRKPKPDLLRQALAAAAVEPAQAWMVGDGVTDVEAGVAAGVKTAFLGPRKCDACRIFSDRRLTPDFWGARLDEFARLLVPNP